MIIFLIANCVAYIFFRPYLVVLSLPHPFAKFKPYKILSLSPNSNPREFSHNSLSHSNSLSTPSKTTAVVYFFLSHSLSFSLFLSHFLSNKTNPNHTTKQTNSNGLKNSAKCNATTHSYAISWNQLGERSTSHQASKSN